MWWQPYSSPSSGVVVLEVGHLRMALLKGSSLQRNGGTTRKSPIIPDTGPPAFVGIYFFFCQIGESPEGGGQRAADGER